jgi:hypothetical protein
VKWLLLAGVLAGCSGSSEPPAAIDAGPETAALRTCVRGARATAIPATCNGAAELCDRAFDRVSSAMTHNAMSNAAEKFAAPNQNNTVEKQLADGVRGLMLDTHYYDEDSGKTDARVDGVAAVQQAYLCHGNCQLGRRPLLDTLCDLTNFLDRNRGEVVSIIFESYVTPADTVEVMRAAGLTDYVYTPGGAFPTLREMIAKDTRLVVFTESDGGTPAWYQPAWSVVFDTPYSFTKPEEFSCALNRGSKTNPLFLLNHWIGDPLPNPKRAAEVNVESVLLARAQKCAMESGKTPNFVGVDFYDLGDVMTVVRKLNGL